MAGRGGEGRTSLGRLYTRRTSLGGKEVIVVLKIARSQPNEKNS